MSDYRTSFSDFARAQCADTGELRPRFNNFQATLPPMDRDAPDVDMVRREHLETWWESECVTRLVTWMRDLLAADRQGDAREMLMRRLRHPQQLSDFIERSSERDVRMANARSRRPSPLPSIPHLDDPYLGGALDLLRDHQAAGTFLNAVVRDAVHDEQIRLFRPTA